MLCIRRIVVVLMHSPHRARTLAHIDLSLSVGILWECVRLDLPSGEVKRALVVPNTIGVKVAVKVVLSALATQTIEQEKAKDGDGCYTTYCTTYYWTNM